MTHRREPPGSSAGREHPPSSPRGPGLAADSTPPTPIDRLEAFLTARRRAWLLTILVFGAIFRLIYFVQLSASPCLYQHRWTVTDMNFFDLWSSRIASGDLLTGTALHPLHDWHQAVAAEYFKGHPGEEQALLDRWQGPVERPSAAALLWDRWLGGKTFHQEPLYPYMLAAFIKILGHDVRWVFLWQMLLSLGGILLVYGVAQRCFGELVAAVATVLTALCGPLLYYDMLLLRESMIGVAGLLLIYLIGRAYDRPTLRRWLALGFTWGLATLLKSHVLVMLAMFLGILLWSRRRAPREAMRQAGALLGGLLLALLPAIARNLAVGVSPLSLSSVGPITFVCANTPDCPADAGFFHSVGYIVSIMPKAEGRFIPCIVETLRTYGSPFLYAGKVLAKFAVIWNWYETPDNSNFYYYRLHAGILRFLPVTFWLISPLALGGLVLGVRRARKCWPLLLLVATIVLSLVFFGVSSRLRSPLLAPLAVFAALCAVQTARWLAEGNWRRGAGLLAMVAAVSLWTGRPLPEGRSPIRAVDCITPYTVVWGATIDSAMSKGDYAKAAAVLERSLRFEPESVKRFGPQRRIRTLDEAELVEFYIRVHLTYGKALDLAGRAREAEAQRARAQELAAAQGPG